MLSGTQLLDNVDERLLRADRDLRAAQQEMEGLAQRRDRARALESEALRALARMRLAAIRDGEAMIGRLDEAEQRVRALLADRAAALQAREAALAERQEALAAAQAERDRRVAALREAEAEQGRLLEAARQRAEADPEWRRLRAAAEEAARIATHATQKAALAHQDLEAKGRPYLEDPLFAYLWERGWGTSRYAGAGLARMLDGWTARVARYEPARRDYALLSALPARLDAHAERMREEAAAAAEALARAERRIAGLPENDALKAARDAHDMAEQALENAHAALGRAEAERDALAAGQDGAMREAEARLESALGAEGLRALREAARRTPTPEDDAIVARLEAAAADRARAEQAMETARASVEAARQRRTEVERLRAEMRGRGWGQDRWDFKDGALVGVLIGELLRGALSRDGFWDRMGRHRVPARRGGGVWGPMPGPMSGPMPGPWGGGAPGPGPWSLPDRDDGNWGGGFGGGGFGGGGFGGGGFRTGGGMDGGGSGGGGGGFRTGGGF